MTKFVEIVANEDYAAGIDDDGEVWILCGVQNRNGNAGLPRQNYTDTREIKRPVKTNWMLRACRRARSLKPNYYCLIVEAIHEPTNQIAIFEYSFDKSGGARYA